MAVASGIIREKKIVSTGLTSVEVGPMVGPKWRALTTFLPRSLKKQAKLNRIKFKT